MNILVNAVRDLVESARSEWVKKASDGSSEATLKLARDRLDAAILFLRQLLEDLKQRTDVNLLDGTEDSLPLFSLIQHSIHMVGLGYRRPGEVSVFLLDYVRMLNRSILDNKYGCIFLLFLLSQL